jgi:hypothetical protein
VAHLRASQYDAGGGVDMGLIVTALKRAALLLAVWGLACVQVYRAAASTIEHRRLSSEVASMQADYEEQMADYSKLLAESHLIRTDKPTQINLLKKKLGYTEPDETPIIILPAD